MEGGELIVFLEKNYKPRDPEWVEKRMSELRKNVDEWTDCSEIDKARIMAYQEALIVVKDIILADVDNGKMPWNTQTSAVMHRVLRLIETRGVKTYNIEKDEAQRIWGLRETGYSLGLLAYIFDRSKSSIQRVIKKVSDSEIEEILTEKAYPGIR